MTKKPSKGFLQGRKEARKAAKANPANKSNRPGPATQGKPPKHWSEEP